jgi:N4-(beta-N-acetylglucosaminyl)-L-asparaginase
MGAIKHPITGTINCLAINDKRELSGTTTTSGLAWKLAGRVGDSPLIGCGLFVDNEVGAAGSTGRGEEAIKINGTHTVVEMMRKGASPRDAAMEAVSRVARNYGNNEERLSQFNITFYALNKNGEHAAVSLWNEAVRIEKVVKSQYAVCDADGPRLVDSTFLFKRKR